MPELVGMRLSDAYKMLEENDIAYEIVVSEEATDASAGKVIDQSVSSGEQVEKLVKSAKVTITVGALSK